MLISTEKYHVSYLEDPMDRQIIYATSVYTWGLVQNGTRNYLQRELQNLRAWLTYYGIKELERTTL